MEGTILINEETGKKYKLVEVVEQDNKKKFAFVIGHTSGPDKGAFSPYLEKFEYDLFKEFANKHLSEIGDIFLHDENIISYTQRQADTATKTTEYEYVFELHFNSAKPAAEGCEALYYTGNTKAEKIGQKFCSLMVQEMDMKNRGAKALNASDRGFGFVSSQKPTALILEPFFGSNSDDCRNFKEEKYKKVIFELINYINAL